MEHVDYSNMTTDQMFELYRQNFGEPSEYSKTSYVDSSPGAEEREAAFARKRLDKGISTNELSSDDKLSPLAQSLGISEKQIARLKEKKATRNQIESETGRRFPAPATLQSAFGFGGNQTTGALTGTAGDTRISDPVFGYNPATKQFEILENK